MTDQPLLADEGVPNCVPTTYEMCEQSALPANEENMLEITDGQFSWNMDGGDITLKNINLHVKKGLCLCSFF